MNLSKALRVSKAPCLALVGAGGKTTALFQLARELAPAVVTATTHIGAWQIPMADHHFVVTQSEPPPDIEPYIGYGMTLVTGPIEGNRMAGIPQNKLDWLHDLTGYHDLPLLIEADGARQKPLKAPAEHEPVIPEFVETVVVVASLSGLGKPLTEEWVHRVEQFEQISKLARGEIITPEALARVVADPQGGQKNIPPAARRVALLNQADTSELQAVGGRLAGQLLTAFHAVVIASLRADDERRIMNDGQPLIVHRPSASIHAVYEPIAAIILAAGESSRFGQPKQLLDWHGKPFIRHITETAIVSGLSSIVVVTGAHAEQVETAIQDLPVQIVRNDNWREGQSSSIRAGLNTALIPSPLPQLALSEVEGWDRGWGEGSGAAIFLLADQPQVTPTVLRALMDEHARTLAAIIAPLVEGQRANPVLFDRVTFPDLLALKGDAGGRAIFSKYNITYLPWHDAAVLFDVDTPEDYQRLLESTDL